MSNIAPITVLLPCWGFMFIMPMKAVLFLKKNAPKKDGSCSVLIRYYAVNKQADFQTGVSVAPDMWDDKKLCIRKQHQFAVKWNILIEASMRRAGDVIYTAQLAGDSLSVSEFRDRFEQSATKRNTLLNFTDAFITEMKSQGFADTTIRNYRNFRNKIELFAKDANFKEANTLSFIERFEAYMLKGGDLSRNGRNKQHATLRAMLNRASMKNIIDRNAYDFYKMSHEKITMSYLSQLEVTRIHKYMLSDLCPATHRNTCTVFLFCCYTGLRYSDIEHLKYYNIEPYTLNGKEHKAIRIRMQKTQEEIIIPLSDKALAFVGAGLPEATIFAVYTNQAVNRHLKEITKAADISKAVTFHTARHTFATLCISLGIDIKVVSKLLGHSKVAMTEIYAKVMDAQKFKAMEAWGDA